MANWKRAKDLKFQTNWQAHGHVDYSAEWRCNHDNSKVPIFWSCKVQICNIDFKKGGFAKHEFLKNADNKTIPKGSQQFIKARGGNKQLIQKTEYERI